MSLVCINQLKLKLKRRLTEVEGITRHIHIYARNNVRAGEINKTPLGYQQIATPLSTTSRTHYTPTCIATNMGYAYRYIERCQ
uniref:Uncharacterized protein n=1 Tax=Lutzomyia longipalpis TaxID=7200 RepID=A0A1B0EWT4_LUTLO